jgi:hypothetical protein
LEKERLEAEEKSRLKDEGKKKEERDRLTQEKSDLEKDQGNLFDNTENT